MADIDLTSQHEARSGSTSTDAAAEACPGSARLPLSCERIVDAAVRFVDHDCLDALSMRRLGAELGVEAMSLYRYFPSKAALLDAVVCRMLSAVVLPDSGVSSDWERAVHAYARSFRAACAEHPRLLPLLATMGGTNSTLAAIDREMVGLWRIAGFDAATAGQAQAALQGFVTGICLQVASNQAEGAFTLGLHALIAGLRARLTRMAAPA